MSGHGFEVTGDPADLPPGVHIIPLDITATVEHVARALYEDVARGAGEPTPYDALTGIEKHNMCELALTAVHALTEQGWHPAQAHEAIAEAMAEDAAKKQPPAGMDPR